MVKAIIFDWGGVLIDDPSRELMQYCAYSLGVDAKALETLFEQYKTGFQKGTILEEDVWKAISITLKVQAPRSPSLWKDAVRFVFKEKKEVYELLRKIRENGYKTCLLSNTEEPTVEYFYENKYDQYFDALIFSCVEKCVKPDQTIYRTALDTLQVAAHESVFIDNTLRYVQGATEVGMSGILFQSIDQLAKEFAVRSIKIG